MANSEKTTITVQASIKASVEKVWALWTNPWHIVHWNNASDDWHTPKAENDIRAGGKFLWRMEAKDGSMGFDFVGVYNKVEPHRRIEYTLDDDRVVAITFASEGDQTTVTETFEAEDTNSLELQQQGWQSILDNFKRYVEAYGKLETLHFEISINAKPERVFEVMLDEKHFSEWTAEFNPTSRFEGSWEKGSKIVFVGTDQDGKTGGMLGQIKENIPNKFVSIEYYGLIQDGEEITSGPEIEGWAGSYENYTFTEVNGATILSVDVDTNHEFINYFKTTWPKALDVLKSICEQ
jgi:uncharacterized protein YndB with AHSA1/START domain